MRFFEIKLARTTAVERPHEPPPQAVRGRRLAVPDLVTLRERLLGWPLFASFFDGVALDASALLDCDPAWLADRAAWFRRHRIRILVDARRADAETVAAVCERAVSLPGLVEVLLDAPAAGRGDKGGKLSFVKPAEVNWLAAGTVPNAGPAGIDVLEADCRAWESVYADAKRAWLDTPRGRIMGPVPAAAGPEASPPRARPPAAAAGRRFVAVHGIGGLPEAVAARPGLLDHFAGLLLDAEWLESRSDAAVRRDAAWLAERSLGTIVDFSRSINRFPDLTFSSGVPHQRKESVRRIRAVLDKMKLLGSRAAVITSHEDGPTGSDWDDQRRGIEDLLTEAASRGITVHWRPSSVRPPKQLDKHAALVADLRKKHTNLRLAAATVDEPDPARLREAAQAAGGAEIWLVAAPPPKGRRCGVQFLPLVGLPTGNLAQILTSAGDALVVFDADYLSWDECLTDLDILEK